MKTLIFTLSLIGLTAACSDDKTSAPPPGNNEPAPPVEINQGSLSPYAQADQAIEGTRQLFSEQLQNTSNTQPTEAQRLSNELNSILVEMDVEIGKGKKNPLYTSHSSMCDLTSQAHLIITEMTSLVGIEVQVGDVEIVYQSFTKVNEIFSCGLRFGDLMSDFNNQDPFFPDQPIGFDDCTTQYDCPTQHPKPCDSVKQSGCDPYFPNPCDSVKQSGCDPYLPNPCDSVKQSGCDPYLPNPCDSVKQSGCDPYLPNPCDSVKQSGCDPHHIDPCHTVSQSGCKPTPTCKKGKNCGGNLDAPFANRTFSSTFENAQGYLRHVTIYFGDYEAIYTTENGETGLLTGLIYEEYSDTLSGKWEFNNNEGWFKFVGISGYDFYGTWGYTNQFGKKVTVGSWDGYEETLGHNPYQH